MTELTQEKHNKKIKVSKLIGETLLCVVSFLLVVVLVLFCSGAMICRGDFPNAKNVFVTTLLETGQMKFLVSLYLSEDEIKEVVNANSMESFEETVDLNLIRIASSENENDGTNAQAQIIEDLTELNADSSWTLINEQQAEEELFDENGVRTEEIAGRGFRATMMIIKDPSRVAITANMPNGEWPSKGITLDKLVKKADAVGGVNSGLYYGTNNTGGKPYGICVSEGKILRNKPKEAKGLVLIGLNEDGILIIEDVSNMTEAESKAYIEENRIRDACCFQEESSEKNNHFVKLIINGVKREMNGMGSGLNPRTVIGQRADGAILFLVTDGRASDGFHLGASASDLIEIMEEYGAVNAANLDGGSSSCMYYEGEYLRTSVTFYYDNASWNLPTAWVIKKK